MSPDLKLGVVAFLFTLYSAWRRVEERKQEKLDDVESKAAEGAAQAERERIDAAIVSERDRIDAAMLVQEKEIKRVDESEKSCWAHIDRIKEERSQYLTRADHESLRKEIKDDLKELGDRLSKQIEQQTKAFGDSIRSEVRQLVKEHGR